MILKVIKDINNIEKQIKLENKVLIQKEFKKNKNINQKNYNKVFKKSKRKTKKNNINHKCLQNKNINNSLSKRNPSKNLKKNNDHKILDIKNRKIDNNKLTEKKCFDKSKTVKTIKEEKYKEIIKFTSHFYKDNKQTSIKSIDILTNTNSDISSVNSSFFINYKLGGDIVDKDELNIKSIKEISQNYKINNDNINNENEIYIKNCKIIKLNNITKDSSLLIKPKIIYFNKNNKMKNGI